MTDAGTGCHGGAHRSGGYHFIARMRTLPRPCQSLLVGLVLRPLRFRQQVARARNRSEPSEDTCFPGVQVGTPSLCPGIAAAGLFRPIWFSSCRSKSVNVTFPPVNVVASSLGRNSNGRYKKCENSIADFSQRLSSGVVLLFDQDDIVADGGHGLASHHQQRMPTQIFLTLGPPGTHQGESQAQIYLTDTRSIKRSSSDRMFDSSQVPQNQSLSS